MREGDRANATEMAGLTEKLLGGLRRFSKPSRERDGDMALSAPTLAALIASMEPSRERDGDVPCTS